MQENIAIRMTIGAAVVIDGNAADHEWIARFHTVGVVSQTDADVQVKPHARNSSNVGQAVPDEETFRVLRQAQPDLRLLVP